MITTKAFSKARLVFILFISLAGCVGPKKMNQWASNQYGETVTTSKVKSDYITVTSPLITENNITSTSVKKTKSFLPLIVFWQFNYLTSCTLNPKIPVNLFYTTFLTYANSKGLKQKLNGQKLELTIEKIPSSFSLNDDEHVLLVVSWERIYLLPEKREIEISYKIMNGSTETKEGNMVIPDGNKIIGTKFMQSMKNATQQYLIQYDENIKAMAKHAAEQIMNEL